MTETADARRRDLLSSGWKPWLIWGVPWLLVIVAESFGNTAHTILWPVGFSLVGMACLVNARRCGRRHCLYTGPLYLLSALASLLYGMHLLPIGVHGWDWILGITLGGTLFFCCVLEPALGRYSARD